MTSPANGGPSVPESMRSWLIGLAGPGGLNIGQPVSYFNSFHDETDLMNFIGFMKQLGAHEGSDHPLARFILCDPSDPSDGVMVKALLLKSAAGRRVIFKEFFRKLEIFEESL